MVHARRLSRTQPMAEHGDETRHERGAKGAWCLREKRGCPVSRAGRRWSLCTVALSCTRRHRSDVGGPAGYGDVPVQAAWREHCSDSDEALSEACRRGPEVVQCRMPYGRSGRLCARAHRLWPGEMEGCQGTLQASLGRPRCRQDKTGCLFARHQMTMRGPDDRCDEGQAR